MKSRNLLLILLIILSSYPLFSQTSPRYNSEEKDVLDVVNLFFESMTKRDTATMKRIMTKDGRYYGLSEKDGTWKNHTASHQKYIKGLSSGTEVVEERIWDPVVKIHKTIAIVWAPYDIHVNGKFLHCGIDAFSLIKLDEGWKIAATVFTIEPDGCVASPLGQIESK